MGPRLLVALALALPLACAGPVADESAGRPAKPTPEISAAPPRGEVPAPPATPPAPTELVRPKLARDLIAEAGRAELDAGGIVVDVGSIDMHKYSRGGWMSGWGRNALEDETTVASISARSAWLDVVSERPVKEILVRAKGRGKLGVAGATRSVSLTAEFAVHRLVLRKPLPQGRHRITLQGRKAQIDWLWLSEHAGQEPPTLERVSKDGGLLASKRSYSYFLLSDSASELSFRLTGEVGAKARIRAQVDGEAPVILWEGTAAEAAQTQTLAWPEKLSGKAMQLRLESDGALWWHDLALLRPAAEPPTASSAPKNVIVLLIDTQRADSFSVVNPEAPLGAAAYEALVRTSTTFQNAYNNENWTKPSIATIDTGLYPTSHLARWRKDRCSTDLHFLSEHLKEAGFQTAALVSNMSAGPKFGFNQGWGEFKKTDNAKHAFGKAVEWLDGRDKSKPYFLYVQTIDPHVPFSVPEGSAETLFGGPYKGKLGPSFEQSEEDALNEGTLKLGPDDARWLRALYDAEVLYHDEHLGKFVAALAERGILGDTAFVILNDHGEEFGEHGRWGHSWTMGDALHRSPLLMHFPGFFPAETVSSVVEHVDVAPTIVASLGLPQMPAAQGTSLLPLLRKQEHPGLRSALLFGRPKKRAVRVGDYKLVLEGNRKAALYNSAQDPQETTDLLASHSIARRLCEVAMGEAIANPKKSERLEDRSELPKIRAQFISE